MAARPYKPFPWPWVQPSILDQEEPPKEHSWLDDDFGDDDSDLDDYIPSDASGASSESEYDEDDTGSESNVVSDSELAEITADARTGWNLWLTESQRKLEEEEDLPRLVAELVKAEQDAAAAYDPDEVVSLVTQLYELLVTMGHWEEGSIRYAPHTEPAVNTELAAQLGYTPAAISLMQRLPYPRDPGKWWDENYIIPRTRFPDYTDERYLKEGRHPYPYQYMDGDHDIDPWLLPLFLPSRDGCNVLLDTNLGVVRAYSSDGPPPDTTVESRRYGKVPRTEWQKASWKEYRRAPLVPVARYLSELIYAYRSLERLLCVVPEKSDHRQTRYSNYPEFFANLEREEQEALLQLYPECGWSNTWRRAEFMSKWEARRKEINDRARQAMASEDHDKRDVAP